MKFNKIHKLLTEEEKASTLAKKLDDLYNTDTLVKKYIDTVQVGSPMHNDAKAVVEWMIRADELDMPDLVSMSRRIMAAAVKQVRTTGRKIHLYNKENGSEKQAGICSKCGMMCYGITKEGQYLCMNCLMPSKKIQGDPLFDKKYQDHIKKERRKKAKEKEQRDDWFVPKDKFFGEQ